MRRVVYIVRMPLSETEIARAQVIEQNYQLFKGNFDKVLRFFRSEKDRLRTVQVMENVCGNTSFTFADLMFGKEPMFRVSDSAKQEVLAEIARRNTFHLQLYEAAISQSYAGYTAFKMYKEDNKVFVEEVDPSHVFPQFSIYGNKRKPTSIKIAFNITISDVKYLYEEEHYIGRIEYKLFNVSGTSPVRVNVKMYDPSLPDYEETGVDHFLVYICNNQKTSKEILGFSDYENVRSLLTEYVRVDSQIATQLKKHADAKLAVPQGVLDERGEVINENMEMIEVATPNETGALVVPQYIVNGNPQIDQCFKRKDEILEALMRTTQMTGFLVGIGTNGAEKPSALRIRMIPTLAKVERKKMQFDTCITQLLSDAVNWEKGNNDMTSDDVSIVYRNNLPIDELEQVQIETTRYNSGLQTKRDAIANMDRLEGESLDEKIQKLEEEEQKSMQVAQAGLGAVQF